MPRRHAPPGQRLSHARPEAGPGARTGQKNAPDGAFFHRLRQALDIAALMRHAQRLSQGLSTIAVGNFRRCRRPASAPTRARRRAGSAVPGIRHPPRPTARDPRPAPAPARGGTAFRDHRATIEDAVGNTQAQQGLRITALRGPADMDVGRIAVRAPNAHVVLAFGAGVGHVAGVIVFCGTHGPSSCAAN